MDNTSFELSASNVFNTFDEAMESIEKLEIAIVSLENAGRYHAKIPGFDSQYFKDMEETFIGACRETMGDRFSEATERNFRLFYNFCVQHIINGYHAAGGQTAGDGAVTQAENRV